MTLLVEIRIRFVTSGKSHVREVSQCFPHWCRIGSTSCPLLWCLAFLIQKHWILQTLEDQILYSFEVSSSLQFCPTLCLIYQNKSCILSFPIQVPRKTNDRDKIYEYIFNFNRTLSLFPHIISSNMDMKMILSMKCSNSHSILFMNFWISSRMSIVVNPQKNFHSNFRLHVIDTIQFLEVMALRIPFNLYSSSCVLNYLSSRPCKVLSRRRHRLWQ